MVAEQNRATAVASAPLPTSASPGTAVDASQSTSASPGAAVELASAPQPPPLNMEVRQLSFSYGANKVLSDVSFKAPAGRITSILGANGSGKSTLFYLMTKNLRPQSGHILLDGQDIRNIRARDYARQVSIVNQVNTINGDIETERLVSYGRTPFLSFMQRPGTEDARLIEWAMHITDVEKFRAKPLSQLSGGQRQRVWLAMALAQGTRLLLLDEPTTYLDIRYQVQTLRLIRRLNKEFGITILMVLHDMNQALYYSDFLLCLRDGRVVAQGSPAEVMSERLIEELYDIRLPMIDNAHGRFVLQV